MQASLWTMCFIYVALELNFTALNFLLWGFCGILCEAADPKIFTVIPKDPILFHRMSVALQHTRFIPGWLVAWTDIMIYLVLASMSLLRVCWQGGSWYHYPYHSKYVSNLPNSYFEKMFPIWILVPQSPWVWTFCRFLWKPLHQSSILGGTPGSPFIWYGVQQYIVKLFFLHFHGVVGSWKGQKLVCKIC